MRIPQSVKYTLNVDRMEFQWLAGYSQGGIDKSNNETGYKGKLYLFLVRFGHSSNRQNQNTVIKKVYIINSHICQEYRLFLTYRYNQGVYAG